MTTALAPEVAATLARTSLVNAELALAAAVKNLYATGRSGQMHRVAKLRLIVVTEIAAIDKPVPPKRAASKKGKKL